MTRFLALLRGADDAPNRDCDRRLTSGRPQGRTVSLPRPARTIRAGLFKGYVT